MWDLKRSILLLVAVIMLLQSGCSGYNVYRRAQAAEQAQNWDEAVLYYLEAVETFPDNISYKAALLRAKIQAAQEHFRQGRRFHEAGLLERALVEFRQAVDLDPTNQYAEVELGKVVDELREREDSSVKTRSLAELKEDVRGVRAQPPLLSPRSDEPIDLIFTEPVSVVDIYRALGKAFGINVLFDPKLRDSEVAIELDDVNAQSALEILMRTVGHFYKVLDEHSIIVADDTPQNRRNYEDQVIQTFFLSNAEVKDVLTMVRTLISAKHVASNEQLNAIVIRDTADKVKVAEQIILTNDKAKAEVVVDVELLQINTNKLRELGMNLSQYSVSSSIDFGTGGADGGTPPVRLSDLEFINGNNWMLTLPSFVYNFIKSSGNTQLLAQPKLRISEGEKASLHIGDRVPIPTTSFNSANAQNGGIIPITSFQYQDIGIKIDIEPRVHHNEEVTLKIQVEVSDISGSVAGAGGQDQPIIGTRTIESTIRLRNGETNFLAGLIRTGESESEQGVPGLSDLPVIGRLFSNSRRDTQRTDIVLTLTPHIVRRASINEGDLLPIWVGTEANITFRGGSPRVESNVNGPFDDDGDARSRVQERLRERLRSLPRGLQDVEGANANGEEPETEQPVGIDLVPAGGLTDIFKKEEEN